MLTLDYWIGVLCGMLFTTPVMLTLYAMLVVSGRCEPEKQRDLR